ncbi:SMI1/KNR4 family protein [Thiopseudomonas denitrificans]|uniref:SUKH superfamily protein n=1 Tax=Thiopseudomonas denitrificans TaxID=1501432 RepID=A0A4R6TV83_9GAMM|nr:SMI1/KNR4 family protein [Thiopseudomonas denitrificans]TDQ37096.1 SUKH superfamily protein [Thiopseudomonas denitrificans]
MEDVIELLREHNQPVPVPLELPTDDDLLDVQEQILIHLPHELREFLLEVSDVVYGHLEPVTASDPHSHTYLPEVAATAWDLGLPRHLVPLCQEDRLYFAVEPDGLVVLWSVSENDYLEDEWESVWHWARDYWLENAG